jgi:hypothetical protein
MSERDFPTIETIEWFRSRLETLLEKTESAAVLDTEMAGWWGRDAAAERQFKDDLVSGRVAWRVARKSAQRGLRALDDGDLEKADIYIWEATIHCFIALETRLSHRPADMAVLAKPAQRRGRPPKKA